MTWENGGEKKKVMKTGERSWGQAIHGLISLQPISPSCQTWQDLLHSWLGLVCQIVRAPPLLPQPIPQGERWRLCIAQVWGKRQVYRLFMLLHGWSILHLQLWGASGLLASDQPLEIKANRLWALFHMSLPFPAPITRWGEVLPRSNRVLSKSSLFSASFMYHPHWCSAEITNEFPDLKHHPAPLQTDTHVSLQELLLHSALWESTLFHSALCEPGPLQTMLLN